MNVPRKCSLSTNHSPKGRKAPHKGHPKGPWRFENGMSLSQRITQMKIDEVLKIRAYGYKYRTVFKIAKDHDFKIATRLVGDGKYVNIYRLT